MSENVESNGKYWRVFFNVGEQDKMLVVNMRIRDSCIIVK